MALMGYREYSRHAGVTLRAVQKAIEAGHIQLQEGKKIDSTQADRDWRNSAEVLRPVLSVTPTAKRAASQAALGGEEYEESDAGQGKGGSDAAETDGSTKEYRLHRASREKFNALTQELEYKQAIGELIAVSEAKRIAYTSFRTIRDSVLNVPARLKDLLGAVTDPYQCEKIMEEALAAALAGIDISKLLQDPDQDE